MSAADASEAVGDSETKELFDSFRVFCNRKSIQCKEVLLDDMDIPKALIDSISANSIELLVLGAPSRGGLVRRFRTTDVPSGVSKGAPAFCTVYIISKGKISSVRSATAPLAPKATTPPPPRNQVQMQPPQQATPVPTPEKILDPQPTRNHPPRPFGSATRLSITDEDDMISPFTRLGKTYESSKLPDSDISFVSSGRSSIDKMFPTLYDDLDSAASGIVPGRFSIGSDYEARSFASSLSGSNNDDYSSSSQPRLSDCTVINITCL
ncbi:U-box domain-containing protein 35, partial [Mucuna pruriens]